MVRIPLWLSARSDQVLASVLTVAALIEVGLDRSSLAVAPAIGLAFAYTLPLAARRRSPLLVHCLIALALVLLISVDREGRQAAGLAAFLISSYTTGRELPQMASRTGLGVTFAAVWTALLVDGGNGADFIFTTVLFGGVWVLGQAMRAKAEAAAAAAQRERRLIDAERVRIARELHDVASHSISVIAVQAQAVRRRLHSEQAAEAQRLVQIEGAAREAMNEMRRVLGALRMEGESSELAPQPGLRELPKLIDRARLAGMSVTVTVAGEPVGLTVGLDLAAYRVVQEALTNCMKHAGPAEVDVCIEYLPDSLRLQIEDNGHGANRPLEAGAGLIGMRERVALYGGTLVARSKEGGGFCVAATLPLWDSQA